MSASALPQPTAPAPSRWRTVMVLLFLTAAFFRAGTVFLQRATATGDIKPLAAAPKPVTVVGALQDTYRPLKRYVGTVEPRLRATLGPQNIAAFVEEIEVRPGARVHKGQLLATLDCRHAQAGKEAVESQLRSLEARAVGQAQESARMQAMANKGFAALNEVDQRTSQANALAAQMDATKATLRGANITQADCELRAPFTGEVAERAMDPGAYARPGSVVLTLVDRSQVRVVVDVPESDFSIMSPGTPTHVELLASGAHWNVPVSRRSPAADLVTRTVRVELDVTPTGAPIPVGTSASLTVEVGDAITVTSIPMSAAVVRGNTALVFVVEDGKAHAVNAAVKGERGATLCVDPGALRPGTWVVIQGRNTLNPEDAVNAVLQPGGPQATAVHGGEP